MVYIYDVQHNNTIMLGFMGQNIAPWRDFKSD